MGNATSATSKPNGKNNNGQLGKNVLDWLKRRSASGALIIAGIGYLVLSGFAGKVYHAAEYMPMIEYRLTLDSLKNIEQDDKIAELEEQLDDIEKMVRDIWRNQVPHWQREKTEITLRGEEPDTT